MSNKYMALVDQRIGIGRITKEINIPKLKIDTWYLENTLVFIVATGFTVAVAGVVMVELLAKHAIPLLGGFGQ